MTKFIALFYLMLPLLLFSLTWLEWYVALFLVTVLLYIAYHFYKTIKQEHSPNYTITQILFISVFALLLCLIAGSGEFVSQTNDYIKHNLLIHDLVVFHFPVNYSDSNFFLCYNLAYYLPIGLIGKLVGIEFTNLIVFLWTWAGLVIVLMILMQAIRLKSSLSTIGIFIIFFGIFSENYITNILYWTWVFFRDSSNPNIPDGFLFFSGIDVFSFVRILAHDPQHFIGISLCTGLMFDELINYQRIKFIGLLIVLVFFWSALGFVCLGVVLISAIFHFKLPAFFSIPNLLSIIPFAVLTLFYLSHIGDLNQNGFIWNLYQSVPLRILFATTSFGLYWIVLWIFTTNNHHYQDKGWKTLIWFIPICLALSIYKIGALNDLLLSVQRTLLVVSFLFFTKLYFDNQRVFFGNYILLIFLICMGILPIAKFSYFFITKNSVEFSHQAYHIQKVTDYDITKLDKLFEQEFGNQTNFSVQYLGSKDSFFFKYLAKKI